MPQRPIEILSAEDIGQIHDTTVKILGEVGVDFPHEDALAIFRKHGVKVDGRRVYLTEDQLMDALKAAPAQFTVRARNPERNVTIGDGKPVFAPGYGAPFLVDAEVGKRIPTLGDYHNLVKLAHQLPNQAMTGHLLVEPGDVSAGSAHLHMLYAHMLHSDKPFVGSGEGAVGATHTIEMLEILFGEEVRREPLVVGLINPLSPLGYSTDMLSAVLVYARHRQPLVFASLVMAGSTGPITLAGVLALQNAELLAGIVLTQLISPGTPVVIGSTSTNIDMKTGALAIGGPELSMMIIAHVQMARHYGLPARSGGSLTDSSMPDGQAGFESMASMLTTVNSGADFVLHAGGILSSYLAFSYEKLVLDDEMCGMLLHYREGIPVSPETLAYDVIARVGPAGNFLAEDHTVERCRSEFWAPAVVDRRGLDNWMAAGRETAVDRARRRWQRLVAEHQDPDLDASIARQLSDYMQAHAS